MKRVPGGYEHTTKDGEVFTVSNRGQFNRAVEGTSRHWEAVSDRGTVVTARTLASLRLHLGV